MSSFQEPAVTAGNLLEGYAPEDAMARRRRVTRRALRTERQRGDGPPWVKVNRQIYYPESGFREWLKSIEPRPVRIRKTAARKPSGLGLEAPAE
jgi:hypothetical protein